MPRKKTKTTLSNTSSMPLTTPSDGSETSLRGNVGGGYISALYRGKNGVCRLCTGHTYTMQIKEDNYGYIVDILLDETAQEDLNTVVNYASMISINQSWKKV